MEKNYIIYYIIFIISLLIYFYYNNNNNTIEKFKRKSKISKIGKTLKKATSSIGKSVKKVFKPTTKSSKKSSTKSSTKLVLTPIDWICTRTSAIDIQPSIWQCIMNPTKQNKKITKRFRFAVLKYYMHH